MQERMKININLKQVAKNFKVSIFIISYCLRKLGFTLKQGEKSKKLIVKKGVKYREVFQDLLIRNFWLVCSDSNVAFYTKDFIEFAGNKEFYDSISYLNT